MLAMAAMGASGHDVAAQGTDSAGLSPLRGEIVFTGLANTSPPPGADDTGIRISGVELSGGLPEMKLANDDYVARLSAGTIRVSEIFDATADLQAAYREAGYALVQVILPQQKLANGGTLQAKVVPGVVEAVDTASLPETIRPRVEQLTRPLLNDPRITQQRLERQLILAGEIPGTALDAGLSEGSRQGAVVIDLTPDYEPVTGFVGFDNSLADSLGNENLSFGVELNSLLGLGETVYGRLSGAPAGMLGSDPRTRTLSLGAVVPVGASGAALNLEWTQTKGTAVGDFSTFLSEYERTTLRYLYPVIRSQQTRLNSQFVLDVVEDRGFEDFGPCCDPDPLFRDRLTVLRFGLSGARTHEGGAVTEGGLTISKGIDALGAKTLDESFFPNLPQSRYPADASFTKITGAASHRRALTDRLNLSVGGRFQATFGDALAASELMLLSGPQELSTFSSGALKGDTGWVVRAELSTTIDAKPFSLPVAVSPYVFGAAGAVSYKFPDFTEAPETSASSFGIGVDLFTKMDSAFKSGSLRIEYGKGNRNDFLPDEDRVSVSGTFRF